MAETVYVSHLHARLRALGAQFMSDRSSARAHVYWIGASRIWVKVVRHPHEPTAVVLTFHGECPCSRA